MLFPMMDPGDVQPGKVQAGPSQAKKRRAATSIEYVFMASLILVACIVGIQHLSEVTRAMFTNNADKTKIMDPSQRK
jgi:Flp pilus assembly pilin Flp